MLEQQRDIPSLEKAFRLTNPIMVLVTSPTKRALQELAARYHVSMSDIIRRAIKDHMSAEYPEYSGIYTQCVVAEVEKARLEKLMEGDN